MPDRDKLSYDQYSVGWIYLSNQKHHRLHRWSLGMHPRFSNGYNYISTLGLKLIHIIKVMRVLFDFYLISRNVTLHQGIYSKRVIVKPNVVIWFHKSCQSWAIFTSGSVYNRHKGVRKRMVPLHFYGIEWVNHTNVLTMGDKPRVYLGYLVTKLLLLKPRIGVPITLGSTMTIFWHCLGNTRSFYRWYFFKVKKITTKIYTPRLLH